MWCLSLLLHHIRCVLEHHVGQIELALLVDIIGRGTLSNIYVPKAEHLIALNLYLCLTVPCRDSSTILRHNVIVLISDNASILLYVLLSNLWPVYTCS